jgi:tetratricopeptide (TPR) repeat protein
MANPMFSEVDKGDLFKAGERTGLKRPPKAWIVCLLIAGLVGLLYFNTLGHLFTNWDDGMIYQNSRIRNLDWEGIKKIFRLEKGETYQPVRVLSYAIDYKFWKLNPMGYRITNILFYILTCILVFMSLQHLSASFREGRGPSSHVRVGLFGALLFAAHPVHVEAVTWLAARKEVLQGFFFFLAFFLYLMGKERGGWQRVTLFVLILFSISLATLSKPSAVVFPAVLVIYEIALQRNQWIDFIKRRWVFFSLATVLSVIFTFILMRVMLQAGGVKPYHGGTFFNNLLVGMYVFLHNIKLLMFTINYSADYALRVPFPPLDLLALIVVLTVSLLAGLSIWSLKKGKVFFFSFFFLFVTLLPYLNIIPISTLLADRYVFIASFSFCFLLGIGFDKLYSMKHENFSEGFFKLLSVAIFLFLLATYSFMTIRQNRTWENSFTLWSDAVEKHPESNVANALLGVVYMDLGRDEKAAECLEKAVQILPVDYESRNNLGIVYQRLNMPEKAFRELMTAMFLNPEYDLIKINLSVFYQRQKEYRKAEELLRELISKNPKSANLYYRLGVLYKEMEDYEAAISELKKGIELAPGVITFYEELGNIYVSRMQDIERGKQYYAQGIEAAPRAKVKGEELRWMIQDLECNQ